MKNGDKTVSLSDQVSSLNFCLLKGNYGCISAAGECRWRHGTTSPGCAGEKQGVTRVCLAVVGCLQKHDRKTSLLSGWNVRVEKY